MRKYLIFSLLLIILIGCKVVSTKKSGPVIYVQKERRVDKDWKLVWQDNFETTALDTTKWTRIPPNNADWGNYMTSDPECYALVMVNSI